jgi:hypothetical protein
MRRLRRPKEKGFISRLAAPVVVIALLVTAGGGAVLGAIYVGHQLTQQEKGGQPPCDPPKLVQGRERTKLATPARRSDQAIEPIRLTPVAGGEPILIAFREHREPRRARVVFDASAPLKDDLKQLTAHARGDFVRHDGERFPVEQISARPIVTTNGLHVTVRLCMEPRGGRNVEPGTYKGTVLVEGRPRVQPASFSVEVSLRDPRTGFVFLWALIAAIAGVVVKLFVDVVRLFTPVPDPEGDDEAAAKANPAASVTTQWWTLLKEAVRPANLLSVLFGLVAGVAAYFLLYLDDDDFGSSKDFFKLAVYCFGATVSGMTVADLGKRLPAGILPGGGTKVP